MWLREETSKEAAVPVAFSRDDTRWFTGDYRGSTEAHPYLQYADVQVQITRVDNQTGSGYRQSGPRRSRSEWICPCRQPASFLPFYLFAAMSYLRWISPRTGGIPYFPATQQRIEQFLFPASIASAVVGSPREHLIDRATTSMICSPVGVPRTERTQQSSEAGKRSPKCAG